jgi:hypothetical protein
MCNAAVFEFIAQDVEEPQGLKGEPCATWPALKGPQNLASGNARRVRNPAPASTLKGLQAFQGATLSESVVSLGPRIRGRCPRLSYASPAGICFSEAFQHPHVATAVFPWYGEVVAVGRRHAPNPTRSLVLPQDLGIPLKIYVKKGATFR